MAQTICFNVFPTKYNLNKMRNTLVNDHGFEEKENQKGPYFYIEVADVDSWQIKAMLNWKGYKYRSYDKRYERSTNYRKQFFANNKGPYRCAYCGKRLKADDLEVDHLIPVAKAKKESSVRTWLQICGMKTVNDPKNLVASCSKCNRKKSDEIGWWVIKGALGRNKKFWVYRNIILTIVIFLGLWIVCASGFSIASMIRWCIDGIVGLFA